MIFVNGHKITPTIFPDQTSQVWNLPDELLSAKSYAYTWHFEAEREIIDLLALVKMFYDKNGPKPKSLTVPYLPYARQDRNYGNNSAFNLLVFASIINMMNFDSVKSVDVHNPKATAGCISNFKNRSPLLFHEWAIDKFKPDYLLFPDAGAAKRYPHLGGYPKLIGEKKRNPRTGEIIGYHLNGVDQCHGSQRILVVDDICDGGATFITAAEKANKGLPGYVELGLCVTHGIFSKTLTPLFDAGYDVFTSNTLMANVGRKLSYPIPEGKTFEVFQWI